MGRFKKTELPDPVVTWLLSRGYEDVGGPCGEEGFRKIYETHNGLYYVWVTINIDKRKIYLYEEYNCGGMISEDTIDLEEEWIKDLDIFIDELDSLLKPWIG